MTNIMQSNIMVTKSDQKKLSKSELIKLLLKHNERIEKMKSKFKGLFLLPEKVQDRWFKNIKTASFHNHHNS